MQSSATTDPRLMQMFNVRSEAVIDYFVDKLVSAVARATIAQPYKAAFELKTYQLMYFVHGMFVHAEVDMQVILTAIVYLDRVRIDEFWTYGDEFICERLTVGALKTAFKWLYDGRTHHTKWTVPSQFSREDVDVMERHFLKLIGYRCWASPGSYLEHYAPLMQYVSRTNVCHARIQRTSIFPPRKPEESRIILPEPGSEIELALEFPEPKGECAANLPDLMYPESDSPLSSPMSMSDDEFDAIFSSDDELSSEDSPEAVTPPDAARHPDCQPDPASSQSDSTESDAHAEPAAHHQQPHSTGSRDSDQPYLLQTVGGVADAEMEARTRFYAADHGTVVYSCGSPQYVPPSPSNIHLHHYAPEPKHDQGRGRGWGRDERATQPGLQMQAWRSSSVSGNTTWGRLGLFAS